MTFLQIKKWRNNTQFWKIQMQWWIQMMNKGMINFGWLENLRNVCWIMNVVLFKIRYEEWFCQFYHYCFLLIYAAPSSLFFVSNNANKCGLHLSVPLTFGFYVFGQIMALLELSSYRMMFRLFISSSSLPVDVDFFG